MLKILRGFLFTLLVCSFSVAAHTPAVNESGAPDALVKSVVETLVSDIKKDPAIGAGDRRKAIGVIERDAAPYFDFDRMTALAVGKNWRRATPDQKKALTEEFHKLLASTYAAVMTQYHGDKIGYPPARIPANVTDARVRVTVTPSGGSAIDIDFDLSKASDGWKVNDIVVGGVSMITVYRDEFNDKIRASGIEGLIDVLKAKNEQLAGDQARKHEGKAAKQ